MIDIQLPPEAIEAARASRARVILNEIEPTIGGCANCGGTGNIYLQFETQNRGQGVVITWLDGAKIYVTGHTYPCPICSADNRRAMLEYAWNNSGLDFNERQWRIAHVAGMIGKENAYQAALDLLAHTPAPAGLVTLFGDYGRGKTGLLKSLTAQFILAGVSARYVRAADLLADIRSTYGDDTAMSEQQIVARVGSLRFLAVDEVDRIPSTDWAMSTMMRILDTRYSRRAWCATMIATNKHPDMLGEQWGYLSSRLRDGARVPMGGEDLRGA